MDIPGQNAELEVIVWHLISFVPVEVAESK